MFRFVHVDGRVGEGETTHCAVARVLFSDYPEFEELYWTPVLGDDEIVRRADVVVRDGDKIGTLSELRY